MPWDPGYPSKTAAVPSLPPYWPLRIGDRSYYKCFSTRYVQKKHYRGKRSHKAVKSRLNEPMLARWQPLNGWHRFHSTARFLTVHVPLLRDPALRSLVLKTQNRNATAYRSLESLGDAAIYEITLKVIHKLYPQHQKVPGLCNVMRTAMVTNTKFAEWFSKLEMRTLLEESQPCPPGSAFQSDFMECYFGALLLDPEHGRAVLETFIESVIVAFELQNLQEMADARKVSEGNMYVGKSLASYLMDYGNRYRAIVVLATSSHTEVQTEGAMKSVSIALSASAGAEANKTTRTIERAKAIENAKAVQQTKAVEKAAKKAKKAMKAAMKAAKADKKAQSKAVVHKTEIGIEKVKAESTFTLLPPFSQRQRILKSQSLLDELWSNTAKDQQELLNHIFFPLEPTVTDARLDSCWKTTIELGGVILGQSQGEKVLERSRRNACRQIFLCGSTRMEHLLKPMGYAANDVQEILQLFAMALELVPFKEYKLIHTAPLAEIHRTRLSVTDETWIYYFTKEPTTALRAIFYPLPTRIIVTTEKDMLYTSVIVDGIEMVKRHTPSVVAGRTDACLATISIEKNALSILRGKRDVFNVDEPYVESLWELLTKLKTLLEMRVQSKSPALQNSGPPANRWIKKQKSMS